MGLQESLALTLHCYVGMGGCRRPGLYFSRTDPKKPLRCLLSGPGMAGSRHRDDRAWSTGDEFVTSVSHDLAPNFDGAILDFGIYNKMQRFVWPAMPAVKGPACTCLRSIGPAAGKNSPCLDDQGGSQRQMNDEEPTHPWPTLTNIPPRGIFELLSVNQLVAAVEYSGRHCRSTPTHNINTPYQRT